MINTETVIKRLDRKLNESINKDKNKKPEFRFWHVEELLNQSADLLDRCLVELEKLEEYEINKLYLKFTNDGKQDEINAEEKLIEKGKYNLPYENSKIKVEATERAIKHRSYAIQHYKNIDRDSVDNERQNAKASEFSLHAVNHAQIGEIDSAKNSTNYNRDKKKILSELFKTTKVKLTERKDASQDGGVLDYSVFIKRTQDLIVRDYKDAHHRLVTAAHGLDELFDYSKQYYPFSSSDTIKNDNIWVREAIAWLVGFMQRDQSFTYSISLKEILSIDDFNKYYDSGVIRLPFNLDIDSFSEYNFIRLRGVSGHIISKKTQSIPWVFKLNLPEKGRIKTFKRIKSITQNELPTVRMGRVLERNSRREPEIVGMNSVRNASIFGDDVEGQIQLEIIPPKQNDLPEDVQLDFILVGQLQ